MPVRLPTHPDITPWRENRLAVDMRAAAASLPGPPCRIVDAHSHVSGERAPAIFGEVARAFGVERVITMTPLPMVEPVKAALGGFIEFMGIPNFRDADRFFAFADGYLADIEAFRTRYGARMIKLWNAPPVYEFFQGDRAAIIPLDSPWRVRQIELAQRLGMGVMVHVADPDTWFKARYTDRSKVPEKREHYRSLERVMDRFEGPWLGAHMGGSPEDLDFLDTLLARHPNFHIDTSATKWVVRELSKHPRSRVLEFFDRWRGRILFGSDIVVIDEHMAPLPPPKPGEVRHPRAEQANSPETAWQLYASRYLALRLMLETDYDGPSPIADPDLAMVDPSVTDPLAGPRLQGFALPTEILREVYRGASEGFFKKAPKTT